MVEIDEVTLEKLVDSKIEIAIEERRKHVAKQFRVWGGTITITFTFLVFIGFSREEMIEKVRSAIIPKSYIVDNLMVEEESLKKLKASIINELGDSDLTDYPDVKETIQKNVWGTLSTDDTEVIKDFLNNSEIDEEIITSYNNSINEILYYPSVDNKAEIKSTIEGLGSEPSPVYIGYFKNINNAKTKCALPFRQNKKRVIVYFSPKTKINNNDALPWFRCPNDYPWIETTLRIEDVAIENVLVVGVERPVNEKEVVSGVRARVSESVSREFKESGIDLGEEVTSGFISVSKAYYN